MACSCAVKLEFTAAKAVLDFTACRPEHGSGSRVRCEWRLRGSLTCRTQSWNPQFFTARTARRTPTLRARARVGRRPRRRDRRAPLRSVLELHRRRDGGLRERCDACHAAERRLRPVDGGARRTAARGRARPSPRPRRLRTTRAPGGRTRLSARATTAAPTSGCSRRASSSCCHRRRREDGAARRSRRPARTCSSTLAAASSSFELGRRTIELRCTFSGVVAICYAWNSPP